MRMPISIANASHALGQRKGADVAMCYQWQLADCFILGYPTELLSPLNDYPDTMLLKKVARKIKGGGRNGRYMFRDISI